jgi:hypothetical protein
MWGFVVSGLEAVDALHEGGVFGTVDPWNGAHTPSEFLTNGISICLQRPAVTDPSRVAAGTSCGWPRPLRRR